MESNKKLFSIIILLLFSVAIYAQNPSIHIVQRGETFTSISNKYGIAEESLKKVNPKATTCYAGLKLSIPAIHGGQTRTTSTITNTTTTAKNTGEMVSYQKATSLEKVPKNKKKNNFWSGAAAALGTIVCTAADVAVAVAESQEAGSGRTDINIDGQGVHVKRTSVQQQLDQQNNQYQAQYNAPKQQMQYGNSEMKNVSSNVNYNYAYSQKTNRSLEAKIYKNIDAQMANSNSKSLFFATPNKSCYFNVNLTKKENVYQAGIMLTGDNSGNLPISNMCYIEEDGTLTMKPIEVDPQAQYNPYIANMYAKVTTPIATKMALSEDLKTLYLDNIVCTPVSADEYWTISKITTEYYQQLSEDLREENNRSSSSSSSSSEHGIRWENCSKCGGTTLDASPTFNEPTGHGYVLVLAGEKCKVSSCRAVGKHWHWPCSHCMGSQKNGKLSERY